MGGLVTHARQLLRESLVLWLLAAIVMLYFRLDVFMLNAMRGSEAVGQYALAARIAEGMLILALAISASSFPRLASMVGAGETVRLHTTFRKVYGLSLASGAATAVALGLLLPILLPKFLPAYAEAAFLGVVLVWAVAFMFVNVQTSDLAIAMGRSTAIVRIAAMNLLVNAGLNLLLIPRYGAMGAVLATVGTEGLNSVVQGLYVRVRLGIPLPLRAWSLPLAGATVVAAATTGRWEFLSGLLPATILLTSASWLPVRHAVA